MCKKMLFNIILLLCLAAMTIYVAAEADVYLSLQIDNPVMTVNGEEIEVDEGRGTAPLIIEGRTLLPVRAVIEAFGGNVGWNEETSSVLLTVGTDIAMLTIDSQTAYFNESECSLDVAPCIINSRTMLPVRFIAECFGFGIAWDGEERKVHIIREVFTDEENQQLLPLLQDYNGEDAYMVINENTPFFRDYEIIDAPVEYYAPLDSVGRCGVTLASLDEDMMPTEERGRISSVTPTGWINKAYDFVPGGYIYNRCHLIGHQLTGENANERNLITGTRYLNIEGMLGIENAVADYVENNENRVMYRVTPIFSGDNLVAHGVLIEAVAIDAVLEEPVESDEIIGENKEDVSGNEEKEIFAGPEDAEGSGNVLTEEGAFQDNCENPEELPEQEEEMTEEAETSEDTEDVEITDPTEVTEVIETAETAENTEFVEVLEDMKEERVFSLCVFCYNVQPGIAIDYKTGDSRNAEEGEDIYSFGFVESDDSVAPDKKEDELSMVYRTPSGARYHFDKDCGGTNSYSCTVEEAVDAGLSPCGKCVKEKSTDGNFLPSVDFVIKVLSSGFLPRT